MTECQSLSLLVEVGGHCQLSPKDCHSLLLINKSTAVTLPPPHQTSQTVSRILCLTLEHSTTSSHRKDRSSLKRDGIPGAYSGTQVWPFTHRYQRIVIWTRRNICSALASKQKAKRQRNMYLPRLTESNETLLLGMMADTCHQRQDCWKLKTSLAYIVNSRVAWSTYWILDQPDINSEF